MALRITAHPRYRTKAFSFLELMAALVVLSILGSIAVGTFLTFGHKAEDTSAKSTLDSLTNAEANWYAIHGSFAGTCAELNAMDSAYSWGSPGTAACTGSTMTGTSGASTDPSQVSVASGEAVISSTSASTYDVLSMALESDTGTCVSETVTEPDANIDVVLNPTPSGACIAVAPSGPPWPPTP